MADTLQEFLVSLGFKVDEAGLKKFTGGVTSARRAAVDLGVQATGAAMAVAAMVTKIAEQYEELYFATLKTGASASSLRAHEFASRAIGISAQQAAEGLGELNMQLKLNPGKEALANMLGIKTAGRDTKQVYNDLIDTLAKISRQGPLGFAVASQYGNQFGISPAELLRRIQLRDEERAAEARYAQKLKESGVDMDALAKKSHDYNQALRDLYASIGLVADQTADKWLPGMTDTVKLLTQVTDALGRAGKATDGWSSTIIALVGAVGGMKASAWLLRLLGLGKTAAVVGGTATALGATAGAVALAATLYPTEVNSGEKDIYKRNPATGKNELTEYGRSLTGGRTSQSQEAAGGGSLTRGLGGGGGGGAPGGQQGEERGSREQVMGYFMSKGWTREQAAGIAATLWSESKFSSNPKGSNDNGSAFGVNQWHADRQAEFKKTFGKDIRESSLHEQLAFIHHELTAGKEKLAGDKLRGAGSAAEAGAVVSASYTRPADVMGEQLKRARLADKMFNASLGDSGGGRGTVTVSPTTTIHISGVKDPEKAAAAAGREVRASNDDVVRNTKALVR